MDNSQIKRVTCGLPHFFTHPQLKQSHELPQLPERN
jgi:hypothetical protein